MKLSSHWYPFKYYSLELSSSFFFVINAYLSAKYLPFTVRMKDILFPQRFTLYKIHFIALFLLDGKRLKLYWYISNPATILTSHMSL